MTNWRELGEVPDSDDESFEDSQSLDKALPDGAPQNHGARETRTELRTISAREHDIWNLPSSSPEHFASSHPADLGHASQLLSQPPLPAEPVHQEYHDHGDEKRPSIPAAPSRAAEHPTNFFLEDEISSGYVRVTSPRSCASSPPSILSKTPTPPDSPSSPRSRLGRPADCEPARVGSAEASSLAAVRLERSLRPRKPIQQHPYRLENAKYTTFMKSHGVKPVHVISESQPAHRRVEQEDSQDQDFQAEESQEASGEASGTLDDDGPVLFDNEPDELALSPSLPRTSPLGQPLRTSSQQTNVDHTDATSLSDEDLPPLERLRPVSAEKRQRALKRRRSQPLPSTRQKQPKLVPDSSHPSPPRPSFKAPPPPSIWDMSSSPLVPQSASRRSSPETEPVAGQPAQMRQIAPDTPARSSPLAASISRRAPAESPIAIDEDISSDSSDADELDATQNSDSDSDVVRQISRKIHGVLPASWLRLDRQQEKPAIRGARRRSLEPSPDRAVKRGVALPRQGSPKPTSTAPFIFDDESEESDGERECGRAPADSSAATEPVASFVNDDDGASVVEEDHIDWMPPGRKRARLHQAPGRAKKQRRDGLAQSVFKGRPGRPNRQPKITQMLPRTKRGAAETRKPADQGHQKQDGSLASRRSRTRAVTPPLLSILDVVEPDAPRFVRIAARTVRRKANLGKTSPSKKLISLASRSDNVDALSVLRDWKSGKRTPRVPVPSSPQVEEQKNRPVLREMSANAVSLPPRAHPQKLIQQGSLDSFVTVGVDCQTPQPPQRPSTSSPKSWTPLQNRRSALYPAQLEEDESENRRRQLNSRKRTLDAFYRRSRKALDTLTEDGSHRTLDVNFTLEQAEGRERDDRLDVQKVAIESGSKATHVKSRFRKRRPPLFVDLEAPQFAHANDPLPSEFSPIILEDDHSRDKIRGLGPYGTYYTHHFEVFPLHSGVFFHESTVIGGGLLRDALDTGLSLRIRHQHPSTTFSLDGRTLRWGAWDDNTSSEFGILIDWVAENVFAETPAEGGTCRDVTKAADFVVRYVLRSASVRSDLEEKAFVSRCLEAFSGFTGRFESADWSNISEGAKRASLEIAVRFCVAVLALRSIALASGSDRRQSTELDDLLKRAASVIIRRLLQCGFEELRTLYGDLQRATFRERGIRSDRFVSNCWVVMIRLLESAAIPRSSFWDITHSIMLSSGVTSSSDAQAFERLWEATFTLLPLCEIDSSGVLVTGMRHIAPVEGWALPQQLLRRVFQLYQANPRQPPGFNDYCRALVGRCHFLVQQWGWRKCTGIIGTIFDFFGSQSLGHLRNEEVYRSPSFLEELDRSPSLQIEAEDRCFHIFIKLLALSIQRLKDLGRLNDIKNLVARTLPNHDRQYLKEDTIHQHDLAALRNHHDLLCTLFWISPADLRPSTRLIEKLVVPASAHKEACLINVRAWNQLARFVITHDEDGDAFRPFAAWRNNLFDQILDQYVSAASDIEQQFRALPVELAGISKAMRDGIIAKNKATALDVLHFSMKASLDVLQRAPTLQTALHALNTAQLQKVFTSLDYRSPGFDWGILRVALETLDHFLGRIDRASEEQFSSEFADDVDGPHLEEAVLLVNEHLTKDFFWMSRATLARRLERTARHHSQQAACAEKTVTLGARIAARFIKSRVTQLAPYFSAGKYGLFSDLPRSLNTPERRYLPLFLAVLVQNDVFDFRDLGLNIFGLWMLAIVKPLRFLEYENYLAEVLQQHNLPFLERATVAVGIPPDYNSNVDFFACAIHYMRKSLRESGSAQSRQSRDEFSKILQLVMQKMKEDLALLRSEAGEHGPYIDFVRQVISLIKSHGVGICQVDPFFTRPSVDYSPPVQDPQLQAAGIVAYGIRLSEKDVTAVPQLFYYLFNNFMMALGNDTLDQECRILGRAMRNAHVTSFVLQFMMPAVIQASAQATGCWALLEVYTVALACALDGGRCVPKELAGDDMVHVAAILEAILAWLDAARAGVLTLSLPQLHIMTLLATVANILQPSLAGHLFNRHSNSDEHSNEHADSTPVQVLEEAVDRMASFATEARTHLGEVLALLPSPDGSGLLQPPAADAAAAEELVRPAALLGGLVTPAGGASSSGMGNGGAENARVRDFANIIVSDVRRSWVVTGDRVMIGIAGAGLASGRVSGAPSGGIPAMTQGAGPVLQGARYAAWDLGGVLRRLYGELGKWGLGTGREERYGRGRRRGVVCEENLLF